MKQAVLIGLGMVSSAYAAAFRDLAGQIQLRGVYARSADTRARFLAEHAPDAMNYPDLAALCSDKAVDFAILITPPNARDEIVSQLAAARIPILMEKPVERTLAAATALCETCEAAGLPLGIVLQHRARPAARKLRSLMDEGTLGPLYAAEISAPWWRPQAYYDTPGRGTRARDGGGVMISQAIHTMDLALSFLPEVVAVTALSATTGFHAMETEDFVTAALRFEGGAVGTLFAATCAYPGRTEAIRLHYAKGSVLLASNALSIDWQDGRHETIGAASDSGAGADPMAFTHDWHRDMITDFAQAVETGRDPLVPGRAALKVHALIEAIEASARAGQRIEVTA